jgi:hypothetical protein
MIDYDREVKNLQHLHSLLQHFRIGKASEHNSLESELS